MYLVLCDRHPVADCKVPAHIVSGRTRVGVGSSSLHFAVLHVNHVTTYHMLLNGRPIAILRLNCTRNPSYQNVKLCSQILRTSQFRQRSQYSPFLSKRQHHPSIALPSTSPPPTPSRLRKPAATLPSCSHYRTQPRSSLVPLIAVEGGIFKGGGFIRSEMRGDLYLSQCGGR
jgi:hypothetical protein